MIALAKKNKNRIVFSRNDEKLYFNFLEGGGIDRRLIGMERCLG